MYPSRNLETGMRRAKIASLRIPDSHTFKLPGTPYRLVSYIDGSLKYSPRNPQTPKARRRLILLS